MMLGLSEVAARTGKCFPIFSFEGCFGTSNLNSDSDSKDGDVNHTGGVLLNNKKTKIYNRESATTYSEFCLSDL